MGLADSASAAATASRCCAATACYFVETYLAVLGLGAVAVPLNPQSPAPEIERELATVGAKRGGGRAGGGRVPGAPSTGPRSATVRQVIATERRTVVDADSPSTTCSPPIRSTSSRSSADTLAALMFTSGTAGSPRAAMLSHGNLLANIDQGRSAAARITADDVVFGVLPLFHIFGLNVVLGLSLASGATVVLVQRFDPSTALDTIRERGITVIPGAPPLWLAFSHFDEAPADSFATVRLALTGAAKMPEEAIRRLQRALRPRSSPRATGSPRRRRSSPARPGCR